MRSLSHNAPCLLGPHLVGKSRQTSFNVVINYHQPLNKVYLVSTNQIRHDPSISQLLHQLRLSSDRVP